MLDTMYPVHSQCGCAIETFHMALAEIAYWTMTGLQTIYSYKIMLTCACLKIRSKESRETLLDVLVSLHSEGKVK